MSTRTVPSTYYYISKILMLVALLLAVVAFCALAVFDTTNPKIWPECIALSLCFAWGSFLVP